MSWSKELPKTPGLYAWCDGKGGAVFTFTVLSDGRVICHNGVSGVNWTTRSMLRLDGLWQPITVELPAPYVPPRPPKVEVYRAKFRIDLCDRWLVKIGGAFIALEDDYGECGEGSWEIVEDIYTDIEKVQ